MRGEYPFAAAFKAALAALSRIAEAPCISHAPWHPALQSH
jgi:hypothetical protein